MTRTPGLGERQVDLGVKARGTDTKGVRVEKGSDVDEILWGGPKGPGLVYTVQNLSEAVTKLALIVGDPQTGLLAGFNTNSRDIADLKGDVHEIKDLIKKALIGLALVGIVALVPAAKTVLSLVGH